MKWKWLLWAARRVDSAGAFGSPVQAGVQSLGCGTGAEDAWVDANSVGLFCVPCLTRLWRALYGVRVPVHGVTALHGAEHVLMFLRCWMSWSEVEVAAVGEEAC